MIVKYHTQQKHILTDRLSSFGLEFANKGNDDVWKLK